MLLPTFHAFSFPFALDSNTATESEFHLRPQYRSETPLDTTLRNFTTDRFPSEGYARNIGIILDGWSSALLRSPTDTTVITDALSAKFSGTAFPSTSKVVRTGPLLRVTQYEQTSSSPLDREGFVRELKAWLSKFHQLLTADFQVTRIDVPPSTQDSQRKRVQIHTRIRYELVGEGSGFYREQRVGYWEMGWQLSSSETLELQHWLIQDETRSMSLQPIFADITAGAFGSNASYSKQLLRGTDDWRSVLDVACGIDIYGHNGVSVGDIDEDGFDDVYVCQPGGLPNRLLRNRGDGTFEDITESSGVGVLENTASALFLDVNNSGRQDLVVVRADGPMLFLNQGGGKFRHQPSAFRFANPPQGTFTGASAADYDRDGWLDIYFCLYVYYQGADQYKYPLPYFAAENGPPNFLMRNNRDGTFRDVTSETGLDKNNTRYSFCCAWNDYNDDGWPDLYVVNDFGRKNLYRNNGDGTFTDVAQEGGVDDVGAGMGVCWFDYDNDGHPDLYVANMWTAAGERIVMQPDFKKDSPGEVRQLYEKHAMGNSLFRNSGAGKFEEKTAAAAVGSGRWSWSSDAWDFDHDGFPDLYVVNGMISGPKQSNVEQREISAQKSGTEPNPLETDLNSLFWQRVVAASPDEATPSREYEQGWNAINELIRTDGTWSGYERNVFYANNRDGTFSDISGAIGLDFREDGRSFALADFDHDGRQELLVKNRNSPQLRLLKNVANGLSAAVAFRLQGKNSNRDAIGAVITIQTEAGKQTRSLQAGSGFLSQHSKELFFGIGDTTEPVQASIRWPSGLVQQIAELPANHRIWIEEGSSPSRIEPFTTVAAYKIAQQEPVSDELPTTFESWLIAPVDAPDFSAPDLAGQIHTLSSYRGKPVLLSFWVSNSSECQQDLKTLNQAHPRCQANGLKLLAVNFDHLADSGTQGASARKTPSFTVLRGSDDIAATYTIVYRHLFDRRRDLILPTSLLINERGEIVKIYRGPSHPEQIDKDLRQIPNTPAERLGMALPFPGVTDTLEFGRNYLSYGSVFFQRGYVEQAEQAFQRALRDDPSSAEAQYGLGSVYLNQQKSAEAKDCFQRAIKLHASYPDTLPNAWNNLGLIVAREGHAEQAIPYFEEALRQSPDHVIALDNLGNAYRSLKRWDDSKKAFDRALAINPQDPEANYGLGMVFATTDDTNGAYEYLQKALSARPAYPEALNNLGILYLRTQRRDQAVASFKECMRVAPGFEQAYINLAKVYEIEGTPADARSVLLDLLKHNPTDEQAQKMLQELGQ